MWRRYEENCKALTMLTHHYFIPPFPVYPNLDQLGQHFNSVRVHTYSYPQHMNMYSNTFYIYNMDVEKKEGNCKASTISTCHYFTPPSPDYVNPVNFLASSVTV
jgi:hypothetical protein